MIKYLNSRLPLGMLGSLVFCLSFLPLSGRGHKAAGLVFSGFAFMHIYQKRKVLRRYLEKEGNNIKNFLEELGGAVKIKMLQQLPGIKVMHYIPGRVRIYSPQLHHNQSRALDLDNFLSGVKEINNFSVNHQTGTVLIEYSPESVSGNKFLQEIEKLIVSKYKGGNL